MLFTYNRMQYVKQENGYCFKLDTKGVKTRIGKAEWEEAFRAMSAAEDGWDIENEVEARKEAEEREDRETEDNFNGKKAEKKTVKYNGKALTIRGGAWCDVMNSGLYTVIGQVKGYDICKEKGNGEMFVLPNPDAKAVKRTRKSKDIAHESNGVTLTAKQVDFMKHLSDTNFWENGLDSALWCDILADEIGGQFAGKPMTVGAMISTLREKELISVGKDLDRKGKPKFMVLTEIGKQVAKELGLN